MSFSVDELLVHPAKRVGLPDRAIIRDENLEPGVRWKRLRQWSKMDDGGVRLLPWIVLNPAGNRATMGGKVMERLPRTGAGWTMARLSWFWGFDGFCQYNLFPFEDKNPAALPSVLTERAERLIAKSYDLIAVDISEADATMVAWGSENRQLTIRLSERLLATIDGNDSRRGSKINAWCIGVNKDGNPRHASRIKVDLLPQPFPRLSQGETRLSQFLNK